ncbi:uncharacterized protein MELLADRAFT_113740 [Melampsora larici-populina 98AG31]|uniref:Uncharacterized protein n=1 Tax=Melampsora larici-populina (strain 98AG31 / pathotype 3-4-7) TaxID=747676 RepID=F4SAX3_MELLP|nr:uncharacterized protein MELLADRAFT_113740 [Melampsora larici-populina 98AG31]EGF98208.1 hypothetical protein MELLADRAFT_113740 [Melampsora larici-populina 98AG31]
MADLSSLLQSATIPTLRSYMLEHFPCVVVRDGMKLQELKRLAKKWDKLAQDSPAFRKRPSDSTITSNPGTSDCKSAGTSVNADTTQPTLKKQKLTAPRKTPRRSEKTPARPQTSPRVAKPVSLAPRRRSQTSSRAILFPYNLYIFFQPTNPVEIAQPTVSQPVDIVIEEIRERSQMDRNSKPRKKSKKMVTYSSSLTSLSDDEDRLESRVANSQPKQPIIKPDTSNTTLVDIDELEDLLFNPAYNLPTVACNQSSPCKGFPEKLIDAPDFVPEEINLMHFDEDHLQDQDEKGVNHQVHLSSSQAYSCKNDCHEEIRLLKARIQKLEDIAFPKSQLVASCGPILSKLS